MPRIEQLDRRRGTVWWSDAERLERMGLPRSRRYAPSISATAAYTGRCGAELALICDRIPIPRAQPLALSERPASRNRIDAYTDPAAAGYHPRQTDHSPSDEMLALVAGDQITENAILGCTVPEPARPVRCAIDDRHEPDLNVPILQFPPFAPPIEENAV